MNRAVMSFLPEAQVVEERSTQAISTNVARIYKGEQLITGVELADELGSVHQQIEALQAVADNIKERMAKCGPGLYFGDEHKAKVYWGSISKLDVERITREMGEDWVSQRTTTGPCIMCETTEISLHDIEKFKL